LRTSFSKDAAACGVLLIVALAWSAPIAQRLATDLPGTPVDTDVATMAWNVAWVQRAIDTPATLLRSEAVLVPFGADLRAHTYGLFPAVMVWPVARAAGALTAFNVMLIATLILNGWLGYLLFRDIGTSRASALVAASALMLSGPALEQFRVGRPIFAAIWITCAALFATRRLLARPTALWTATLGGALVAALFTDLQILLFTTLWVGWIVIWHVASGGGLDIRRAAALAIAGAIVAIPFLLIVYPAFGGGSLPVPDREEAVRYSFRWWDYLTLSVMPRAIGGYELALAAIAGVVVLKGDRRLRGWWFGAAVFLVLALGPTLKFTGWPLPFALFSWWPPFGQFRVPSRLTIPAAIGLAAVLALLLDRVLARFDSRRAAAAVASLLIVRVLLAMANHPFETQQYQASTIYTYLSRARDAGTLIEVPVGVRSGLDRIGHGEETLQYYQMIHGRPIINAMVARLPAEVFAFYRSHPSLMLLAGEPVSATDQEIASDLDTVIDAIKASHIVMHPTRMIPGRLARITRLLDTHPRLRHWISEGGVVAYRVIAY
jgi:hypothetical protein